MAFVLQAVPQSTCYFNSIESSPDNTHIIAHGNHQWLHTAIRTLICLVDRPDSKYRFQVDPARVQKILEDLEEAELERVPADFKTPFSV